MAANKLGLTRDQLASFLGDFEQIKQFEKLFSTVNTNTNDVIPGIEIAAGNSGEAANDALAQIMELAELVALINTASDANSGVASLDEKVDDLAQGFAVQPRAELGTMSTLQQAWLPWVTFDNAPGVIPTAVGSAYWDGGTTLGVQMTANVLGRVNEDLFYYIKASSAITKGQVIMFTGAVGASGVPTGAPATGVTDGSYIMGVAAESIALNGFGLVQFSGTLKGINTSAFSDGDILWYDPAITGGFTKTKPSAPNIKVQMAAVINAGSGGSGSILIRVNAGSVLGGTDSNVQFSTLTNNDLIQYDGALQYWKNVPASSVSIGTATNLAGGAANRIAYQTGAGATSFIVAPTIANTFLEWSGSAFQWSSNPLGTVTSVSVVSANGLAGTVANPTTTPAITLSTTVTGLVKGNGTALSAASAGTDYVAPGVITTSGLTMVTSRLLGRTTASTGAVEEITVGTGLTLSGGSLVNSAPDQTVTLTAGTGISISGSYPSFTITNSAPDKIVSLTGAGTTSITGTYPNFTITSNDQYVGTVTSVSGTGTVNGITLTGTVTSSGSITLGGTLSGVSLTTQVTGTLPVGNGGTGTATAFTAGSVVFAGASGVYSQDNANLFWDDTNNRLGIGTSSSSAYGKLTVNGNIVFGAPEGRNSATTKQIGIWTSGDPADDSRANIGFTTVAGASSTSSYITFATNNYGVSGGERGRFDQNGYLLLGYTTSNGAYRLQVNSQIFATSATIATSDGRYKENITPITGALDVINALNPVSFDWKAHPIHNFDRSQPTTGFIAQEVQQALSDKPYLNSIVKKNECTLEDGTTEEFLGIAEGNLISLLTAALKEASAKIDALSARVAQLEGN